jgi:hypothetical protein
MQLIIPALILVLIYFTWPLAVGISLGFLFKWSTKTTIIVAIPVAILLTIAALLVGNWTAFFFVSVCALGLAGLVSMSAI